MAKPSDEAMLRDRKALETITGHPLAGGGWPDDALAPGTRVRVVQDPASGGPWRKVFQGTVAKTIDPRRPPNPKARPDELEYYIVFDEPQDDLSELGPYRAAVIWDRYLEVI